MSTAQFFDNNYLDPDTILSATASSEQTNFPSANLYNFQRRAKVWRSAGHWDITSSNNKIVFRESTGVDLTASIAVASYATTAVFLAAIKTAMQAVGASTYTISQDATTLKIKILSNGSGGGGLFQLRTNDVNFTSAATLGFATASNLTGALTYTADTLKISTGEWLLWDLGISSTPEAIILIGPRGRPLKISPTATVKIQGNTTNVWTSPQYEETIPYNENTLAIVRPGGLFGSGLRYWRLTIADTSNTNGYVELGIAYLGQLYSPSQGAVQFPFQGGFDDRSTTVTTDGGYLLTNAREKTEQFSISWKFLSVTETEAIQDIFEQFGKSTPLFIQFDPDAVFSSNDKKYLRYVKFSQEPDFTLDSPGLWSWTMKLLEEI